MSNTYTGDTTRVKAAFRDWAPAGSTGALIDPDNQTVTITVWDAEASRKIETGTATRESTGSYYYDWVSPITEGIYYFEFKGLFSTQPQIARKKFTVRFRPEKEA